MLQAVKSRIERPLLDHQGLSRDLLDPKKNAVAVMGPQRDSLENQ
jgi:hypothetical protein